MASPDEILRAAAALLRANTWMRGTLALRHVAAGDETALRATRKLITHHLGHDDLSPYEAAATLVAFTDRHTAEQTARLFEAVAERHSDAAADEPVIVQPAGYAIPAPPKDTQGAEGARLDFALIADIQALLESHGHHLPADQAARRLALGGLVEQTLRLLDVFEGRA